MTLELIRTELKDTIAGITDIGVVHDYERLATDWKVFLENFKPAGKAYIRGWTIRRGSTAEELSSHEESDRSYRFIIRGYMSLDDANASSKTFDSLIESICDAFRALIRNDLNGKADRVGVMQVDAVEDRMFGSALCHYCELSIIIDEGETA